MSEKEVQETIEKMIGCVGDAAYLRGLYDALKAERDALRKEVERLSALAAGKAGLLKTYHEASDKKDAELSRLRGMLVDIVKHCEFIAPENYKQLSVWQIAKSALAGGGEEK